MKQLITILTLLFCANVFGQFDKLIGTWITPKNETLKIFNTLNDKSIDEFWNANCISNGEEDLWVVLCLKNDTLNFQYQYYQSKPHTDNYDLKIITQTDSFIIIQTVSDFSRKFFKNQPSIKFIKQQYTIDKSIKLEKIIFHTTSCYGTCPTFHLQIDNNKKVKLFIEEVYIDNYIASKKDTNKMGYYIGSLKKTAYKKLEEYIQTCNLQTLEFKDINGLDGSVITLIIYYNGKKKYFKSMFPPIVIDNLISYLYCICENNNFKKTTDKFVLEY